MKNNNSSYLGEFIIANAKSIVTCIIFVCGLYIQYQASMMRIDHMEREIVQIRKQVDDQYVKLDNMKLDKAVFEATMRSFADMSADIRQIRDRLEDILGDHQRHNPQQNR